MLYNGDGGGIQLKIICFDVLGEVKRHFNENIKFLWVNSATQIATFVRAKDLMS